MSLADREDEDFVACVYQDDLDGGLIVKMKRYRQIAAGFPLFQPGTADQPIPDGVQMRQIHFFNAQTGQRTTLPWAANDVQFHTPKLTIPIDGVAGWVATGIKGECVTY